jgi:hypothetical protein
VQQVERSVESLKSSLENAAPHASEAAKLHAEKVIEIGERFLEIQRKSENTDVVLNPSKLSLQVSAKRIGGIFRALGIGVVAYVFFVIVWNLISLFQRTS